MFRKSLLSLSILILCGFSFIKIARAVVNLDLDGSGTINLADVVFGLRHYSTYNVITFAQILNYLATPTSTPTPTSPPVAGVCPDMTLRKAHAGEDGRYFYNGCNKPVYLTGSHTWSGVQDYISDSLTGTFVLSDWLNMMSYYGHNYSRGWVWDSPKATTVGPSLDNYTATPDVWVRSGTAKAADGQPKFDLTQVNPAYISRLKSVIEAYRAKNIYFSVMLFNGWCTYAHLDGREVWKYHPFHSGNNINGLNLSDSDDPHTANSSSWQYQESYIRAIVAAVNSYDNVFYEVSNEDTEDVAWENKVVDLVHSIPGSKPIGNQTGINNYNTSHADWWSVPNGMENYTNPNHVIFSDTDHFGNETLSWLDNAYSWGQNPVLMESWENGDPPQNQGNLGIWYVTPQMTTLRTHMGELRRQFEATH